MKIPAKTVSGIFLILIFSFPHIAPGQERAVQEEAKTAPLDQRIPVDPKVKTGQFANGLRYYIRENKTPENRVELRLVVNAGSVLEDDDQQGLAHFLEHMAFNGTKNFAKHELIEFMESIGMRFGPGLNAYTGFDETVYMLQIPTDSPAIMKKAFQILEDWTWALSLENEEIDKERGVIVEEWRLGRGAAARMMDKQLPTIFKGSRYAGRLTIGKKEIIETFEHDVLKRFYRDWYRPDLMAVVAVGDFETAMVESLIKEHFAHLPQATNPRERIVFPVPDHEESLFAIATDKEAMNTRVAVIHKLPLQDMSTVGAYRKMIVEQLYHGMLNQRFAELAQKKDPPFLGAFSGKEQFVRSKEVYVLNAGVEDEGIERGLEALVVESERVARHGFTPTELDRQKRQLLRFMERAYTERGKNDSKLYVSEYIRNFLEGEPIPGIEYEFELFERFIPEISLEEVNKIAQEGKALADSLSAYIPGSSDHMERLKETLQKQNELKTLQELNPRRRALKEMQWTQTLYQAILRITKELGAAKGLNLVLEGDQPQFPFQRYEELVGILSTHKVLYSEGCIDLTNEVIAQLDKIQSKFKY